MKREDLKELSLTDEQLNRIMALHGISPSFMWKLVSAPTYAQMF
ncbi:MAG: hypothetical protein PUA63_00265 [Oscillospiraceae bacterium]|nr:hypothetical protein [Oscillospiraceae bacterium]